MATLVFIPGHWNTASCHDALIEALLLYCYSSATVILPFAGCDAATYDFLNERAEIRTTLSGLSRIRRDVILVLHPSHRRSTVQVVTEKKHAERSLKTGVARMIFFIAHMGTRGFQTTNQGDDEYVEDVTEFELERGTVTADTDGSLSVHFQYLPSSEAQHWAARLLPESVGAFWSTSHYTGWRHIPSQYMLHSEERVFRVPYAHYKIQRARKLSGVH